jgi:hypothetical protein
MSETKESAQAAERLSQAAINDTSNPFVGRWNRLVSTTNWEKGRIIQQWRETLIDSGAPANDYSDEAWSLRVGGVTGQHAGRLRRVWQRFSQVHESYDGLFWSHFQAALDWKDAEMWLEGAVQNRWSVSQTRRQRWETLGALPDQEPRGDEIVSAEIDEDFEPAVNETPTGAVKTDHFSEVQGPVPEGPDFGEEDEYSNSGNAAAAGASIYADEEGQTIDFVKPFENLAELPSDLAEAFESFKLAILRHKLEHWAQISRDEVLASLDALKEMAIAPSPAH